MVTKRRDKTEEKVAGGKMKMQERDVVKLEVYRTREDDGAQTR